MLEFESPVPKSELDPYGAFVSRHSADGNRRGGSLTGLRFCVKDNIEVEGEPFGAGHALFANRRGVRTAPAVARILAAGAEFVGMTRTDSGGFGMTTPGVRNPTFAGCTVGGSSGGAAAAVAAGLADLGLGTDTGGSIRVPAACTGLYGFKPTFGRVPTAAIWPLAPTFDHVGLLARDLEILSAGLAALLADPALCSTNRSTSLEPLSITVAESFPCFLDESVRHAFTGVLTHLEWAGHRVKRSALPDQASLANYFGALVVAEAMYLYATFDPDERLGFGEAAQRALGKPPNSAFLEASRYKVEVAGRTYLACLNECDVLIAPTLFILPPQAETHFILADGRKWPLLQVLLSGTCFGNVIGAPALSVPIADLFSVQLIGRPGADASLLSIARGILPTLDELTKLPVRNRRRMAPRLL